MLDTVSAVLADEAEAEALTAILLHLRQFLNTVFNAFLKDDSKRFVDTSKYSRQMHCTQWHQ